MEYDTYNSISIDGLVVNTTSYYKTQDVYVASNSIGFDHNEESVPSMYLTVYNGETGTYHSYDFHFNEPVETFIGEYIIDFNNNIFHTPFGDLEYIPTYELNITDFSTIAGVLLS